MSHTKERKEKNCLNCNAIVAGRYCQVCGQENIETGETFGHLAGHFIGDIFHFDGMFFSTAKSLLFKPGFLTHEYVRGRRASYLNPIKMYVFVSAIFFLFFLTVYHSVLTISATNNDKEKTAAAVLRELEDNKKEIENSLKEDGTPTWVKSRVKNSLQQLNTDIALLQKDSAKKFQVLADLSSASKFSTKNYTSQKEYDSVQKTLPHSLQDNWIEQKFQRKKIDNDNKFRSNANEEVNTLVESFFHHFPQMLFISLPLFALILQLLYIRRKQFYYANHIIYTVHLYCALFVFLFIILAISSVSKIHYLGWSIWINVIVFLYLLWYTYQALRVYYGQGTGKTILKWLLLNTFAFFVFVGLFILMFFFTYYML